MLIDFLGWLSDMPRLKIYGNGRMGRLLANIPVMEYRHFLAQWQLSIGPPLPNQPLVVFNKEYEAFLRFCKNSWEPTQKIVKEVHQIQKKRNTAS